MYAYTGQTNIRNVPSSRHAGRSGPPPHPGGDPAPDTAGASVTAVTDRSGQQPVYAPRWRWPARATEDSHPLRPWDILGLLPPRTGLDRYTEDCLPWVLHGLSPAAVLAALAVADGLLPAGPRLAGGPQPLRVALFGPGAGAVLAAARAILGPPPHGRIAIAHAVRGRCGPDEPALPPGWWPVLCGPQPPQPPGGDPAGPGPADLRARLAALPVLPPLYLDTNRTLCVSAGDRASASPLLPEAARSMAGALPFLHDRLRLVLSALHAALHDVPVAPPVLEQCAAESAYDLAREALGDLIAFHARIRPRPTTPALRLALAIQRDRPATVSRTTCGVAGVSDDDMRLLADAGWLDDTRSYDDWFRRLPCGSLPPLPRPRGGRWRVPEWVHALPPAAPALALPRRPAAVAVRFVRVGGPAQGG